MQTLCSKLQSLSVEAWPGILFKMLFTCYNSNFHFFSLIIYYDTEKNVKVVGEIKADYLEIRNGSTANTYSIVRHLWHLFLCSGPPFFLLKPLGAELGIQFSWDSPSLAFMKPFSWFSNNPGTGAPQLQSQHLEVRDGDRKVKVAIGYIANSRSVCWNELVLWG